MKRKSSQTAIVIILALKLLQTICAEPSKNAWMMRFDLDWAVSSGLPEKAMLVSLQGLANRDEARLYIVHPTDFQWEITEPLYDFYIRKHGIEFAQIDSAKKALELFGSHAAGYVVWDQTEGTTLNVAFTIAGLEDAIVVTEELIPMAESQGLKVIDDLRGRYDGQSDTEIYADAIDRYWHRCNRDKIMLMGGHRGRVMMPAMADWGIRERMFFHDLSADPREADELVLNRRLLGDLNVGATVFGWHPYSKDTEEQSTMLLSEYGLKMEGLHNLPNLSYNCQFEFTPGFKFTNNHNVGLDEKLEAEEKVYLSFVQSDSVGIGVWTKPGRGKLPFAWQVTMNWTKFSPAALEYFHESATPNDYFIGGLSGPGYMYPNNIPEDRFFALMDEAKELMKTLDERVMEIMDNSAADGNVGNAELFEETVDRYYKAFPDVIGFINGYGPARTRDLRDNRPLISYDYYIDPKRPREEVAADLNELIRLNQKLPYFMLVHVRESNDVNSLVGVVERLEGPVEVVPLDVFLKLAASNKTYETRFRQPDDPVHFKGY